MAPSPGPSRSVEDKDILKAIRNHHKPVMGTVEVADKVELSQQRTSERLFQLEEKGLVFTDKIGRSRIWWLTDNGKLEISNYESENQ